MTQASGSGWVHFRHGADIGVRGYGECPAEAFQQAALALVAVITDPAGIEPRQAVALECDAPDDEVLLLDWLNALIYEMDTRNMLFGRFEVTIGDHRLRATAWGEAVDPPRHRPAVEPKGATFTELKVGRDEAGRWLAQCVVDV